MTGPAGVERRGLIPFRSVPVNSPSFPMSWIPLRFILDPYPPRPHRPLFSASDGLAIFSVLLLGLAWGYPFESRPVVVCALKAWTGIPCLTCGMTRAWVHLAHGRPALAWLQNPLGTVAALIAALLVLAVVARHLFRLSWPDVEDISGWDMGWAGVLTLGALLLNWLYVVRAGVA